MLMRVIGSIAIIAALSACQKALHNAGMKPLSSLAGTEWTPIDTKIDQFVAFKTGGEVIGSGGCNNFFGSFTQNGRSVTFGPLASTKKGCPPDIMSAEQSFLNLLSNVRAAEATRSELILYGDQDQILATLRRRDWD